MCHRLTGHHFVFPSSKPSYEGISPSLFRFGVAAAVNFRLLVDLASRLWKRCSNARLVVRAANSFEIV